LQEILSRVFALKSVAIALDQDGVGAEQSLGPTLIACPTENHLLLDMTSGPFSLRI
jgi:hypothetical protein